MAFEGKHALVTGIARDRPRDRAQARGGGARVAVHYYVNEAAAKETLERIRKHGGDGFLVQADVTEPGDVRRMFARVGEAFGALDIFVANARLGRQRTGADRQRRSEQCVSEARVEP